MAGSHSLWSPSGAKRWRTCPGSVVMNDGVEDKPSRYSAEGTAYHGLAEESIITQQPCSAKVGHHTDADGFHFVVDDGNADFVQQYVDRINAQIAAGHIVHVEVRTDTSAVLGIPGQTGTVDARIIDVANETLKIRDLKFGAGVKVYICEPDDGRPLWQRVNDQLGIYGASEWYKWMRLFDLKFLQLAIDQPRLGHYDEVTLTREEVELFAAAAHEDAQVSWRSWQANCEDARDLRLDLLPSLEACRWCARAGSCSVRTLSILEKHHQMAAKNLPLMNGAELAKALDVLEEIEAWTRSVRAEALSRAEQKSPDAAPGWKMVEGRKGDRSANPADIERRAREALAAHTGVTGDTAARLVMPKELYTTPELKSVAQLEKAVKKLGALGACIWKAITGDPEKGIPSLITQAPGRPTLVRDFDSRPELAPQPVTFELRPVDAEFKQDAAGAAAGLL